MSESETSDFNQYGKWLVWTCRCEPDVRGMIKLMHRDQKQCQSCLALRPAIYIDPDWVPVEESEEL